MDLAYSEAVYLRISFPACKLPQAFTWPLLETETGAYSFIHSFKTFIYCLKKTFLKQFAKFKITKQSQ